MPSLTRALILLPFFFSFWVTQATFFGEEVHLPDWMTCEMPDIHMPKLKNVPWSKLDPTQLWKQHVKKQSTAPSDPTSFLNPVTTRPLALDFRETEKKFEVIVDFPGMNKEDISIKTDGSVLMISGERKLEKSKDEGRFHKVERYYGHTHRSIAIPPNVAHENITASYDEGVLLIDLPKESDSSSSDTKTIKVD